MHCIACEQQPSLLRNINPFTHALLLYTASISKKMDVVVHHTAATNARVVFEHEPLDHTKPSIRLVHLLHLLLPNGQIQCSITHTTIDAEYTCLSYRWGDPRPSQNILVHGKAFTVGRNLFSFLATAREKCTSEGSTTLGPY